MDEARTSKVDDLDFTAGVALDQDVLWFQITVNELEIVNETKCIEDLLCDALQTWNVEVKFLLNFTVVLGILVQVVTQQLRHNEQVLLVVEEINEPQ